MGPWVHPKMEGLSSLPGVEGLGFRVDTIGASIITSTILGVPYYNYGIMGRKTLF